MNLNDFYSDKVNGNSQFAYNDLNVLLHPPVIELHRMPDGTIQESCRDPLGLLGESTLALIKMASTERLKENPQVTRVISIVTNKSLYRTITV